MSPIRILIALAILVFGASGCGSIGRVNGQATEHHSPTSSANADATPAASVRPGPVVGPRPAQWSVYWSGGAVGNGAYVLASSSSLAALIDITNDSASTWRVDYDLYVVRSGPAEKTSAGADMSYAHARNGVWDSKLTGANDSYTASVPAGGHVQVLLEWTVKDTQGQAVSAGNYTAIVPVLIDGVPSGFASASLVVQ
jgi:hypothetical protein